MSLVQEGIVRVGMGLAAVVDNYLILKMKRERFAGDSEKLRDVVREIAEYEPIVDELRAAHPEIEGPMGELREMHERLWAIEDDKRRIERGENEERVVSRLCDPANREELVAYLTLSRQVSKYNDRRAALKRRIAELTGSAIREAKSHNLDS